MERSQVRGFGSVYRQKNSRFLWMSYWHKGRRHRESTGCEKPKAANEILRKRLRDLHLRDSPLADGAPGVLVGDLYESLERDYINNARKRLLDLKIRWHKHLEPVFASMPARALSTEEISVYSTKRLMEKASNATVNRELAVLKRMFKLAKMSRPKFGDPPYFPMLKESKPRNGFVENAEYADLARETGRIGLWLRGLFELGYSFGWRKSELLGLKVSQVDMLERTIVLHAGETKNDDRRIAAMTDTVYELLGRLITGKAPEDRVFTRGPNNRPIAGFRKAWKAATVAAGHPGLLFHDLRRSGVRNLVRAGVPEKIAMTITGHRTRSVFERYNIVSLADVRNAAKLLDIDRLKIKQQALLDRQAELAFEDVEQPAKRPTGRVSEMASGERKVQ